MIKKETILVTGGAGFIGSHAVNSLLSEGAYKIEVVDNFGQSKENIIRDESITYHDADIRDKDALMAIFEKTKPSAVMHFAALASVPDSVSKPAEYYDNNVIGGLNILECMRSSGTEKMIFSSSAAVYGEPQSEEISEDHPKNPTNPYGYTKLVFENMLKDYHRAYGISSISFRYFCAAGCDAAAGLGEYHSPETHVIPCIVQTLLGQRKEFSVFGNDYPTPDGTGIRDYIHVSDLAEAHTLALKKILGSDSICAQYNLGINKGFSVLELIRIAEKISGKKLNYAIKPRRAGDPSRLIADASKARRELGWTPKHTEAEEMIENSYRFFQTNK